MDKQAPKLTLFLSIFSGACISAAWISARPSEIIAAVCIGTAVCATLLIVLRFDRAFVKRGRRRTDQEEGVANEA